MAYTISILDTSGTFQPGNVPAGYVATLSWTADVAINWYYNSTGIAISARFQPKSGSFGAGLSGSISITAQEPVTNDGTPVASQDCAYSLRRDGIGGTVSATSNTVTVYRTPTQPTSVTASNITSSSMTVTGSGGEWGSIYVNIGSSTYNINGTTFSGLSPNTSYTIRAKRINGSAESTVRSSTATTLDSVVLTGSITNGGTTQVVNGGNVTFSWSTNVSGTYYYRDPGLHWVSNAGTIGTGTSGTLVATANAEGTYGVRFGSMQLRTGSSNGTVLAQSLTTTIYTIPSNPTISVGTIGETSIQVTYTNTESQFGELYVRGYQTGGSLPSYTNIGTDSPQTINYTGLTPGTQYTFQAVTVNGPAFSSVISQNATTQIIIDDDPDPPTLTPSSINSATADTYYTSSWPTTGVTSGTDIYWHVDYLNTDTDVGISTAQTGPFGTSSISRRLNETGYVRLKSSPLPGGFTSTKIYTTSDNNSSGTGGIQTVGYFFMWTDSGGGGTGVGDGGTATYGLEIRNASGTAILDSKHRHLGILNYGQIPNVANNSYSGYYSVEGMTATNTNEIDVILVGASGFSASVLVTIERSTGQFRVYNETGSTQTFYFYAVRY